jgi:hypothetical protein
MLICISSNNLTTLQLSFAASVQKNASEPVSVIELKFANETRSHTISKLYFVPDSQVIDGTVHQSRLLFSFFLLNCAKVHLRPICVDTRRNQVRPLKRVPTQKRKKL